MKSILIRYIINVYTKQLDLPLKSFSVNTYYYTYYLNNNDLLICSDAPIDRIMLSFRATDSIINWCVTESIISQINFNSKLRGSRFIYARICDLCEDIANIFHFAHHFVIPGRDFRFCFVSHVDGCGPRGSLLCWGEYITHRNYRLSIDYHS